MSIYSDKLAHIQVITNCQYSTAQMCIWEDILRHLFMHAVLDDVMSQSELTTLFNQEIIFFQLSSFLAVTTVQGSVREPGG